MSLRSPSAPPARPRLSRTYVERVAYLKLVRGQITAEQYLEAIAPPKRARRWRRGRG